jgi:Carboxypeptidase regulatory-like domain
MLIQAVLSAILAMSVSGVSPHGPALLGRVSDGNIPISGAIVTISNRDFVKSTTTDGNGRFILEPVPPGHYDLRMSAHDYAVLECPVIVHGGDSRRNWIGITGLVPVDQQTVSIVELARRQTLKVVLKGSHGQVANGQESLR